MMRALPLGLALAALALPAAARSLQDFERGLPQDIQRMHRTEASPGLRGNELVVYYGQSAGRATVFIRPLASPAPDGRGPVAEGQLRQAVETDLKRGAPVLGDTYWTGDPKTHTIDAEGVGLTCRTIERRQGGEATSPDQIRLLNRWCMTVMDNHILAIHLTTPFKEEMADYVDKAQVGFIGQLAVALDRAEGQPAPPATAETARPPRPNVPIARPPVLGGPPSNAKQ
jgi:hypothetical protein